MKKVFISSIFLFLSLNLLAQNWIMDYSEALEIANQKNQKIILVFQGSDWCGPCIKLDKEILKTDKFKDYANNHYVMLKADFPKKKKNLLPNEQQNKNNILAEKYNKYGYFPFVVVLNKNGIVMGETGYKKVSPTAYIEIINSF